MVVGVDVPEAEAEAVPPRVSGVASRSPSLRSLASFSSLGLSCCQDVLLGSLGIATARRYEGQASIVFTSIDGSSCDALSAKYSLRAAFFV